MIYGTERKALREQFFTAWQKHQAGAALEPLEQQIVALLEEHPEYHSLLEKPDQFTDKDYLPELGETNPFLHLSLHLSLRDQIGMDKPLGIQGLFLKLCERGTETHDAEHRMIDILAECIWQTQRNNVAFDEEAYLRQLNQLL